MHTTSVKVAYACTSMLGQPKGSQGPHGTGRGPVGGVTGVASVCTFLQYVQYDEPIVGRVAPLAS
jgi:hypothetical protein